MPIVAPRKWSIMRETYFSAFHSHPWHCGRFPWFHQRNFHKSHQLVAFQAWIQFSKIVRYWTIPWCSGFKLIPQMIFLKTPCKEISYQKLHGVPQVQWFEHQPRERILQSPQSTVVEQEDGSPFLDGTGHESTDSRMFQQDGEGSHKVLHDAHDPLRYMDILPDFLARYNNRPHSSIYPYSPASVTEENECVVHGLQYWDSLHERRLHHKYDIGDQVHMTQYRGTFRKSYRDKNFTEEVFTIVDKLFTKPPMYRLKDLEGEMIEGSFYKSELQCVCDGWSLDGRLKHPFTCVVAGP